MKKADRPSRRHSWGRCRGFTLIEVMAALLIVSLGMMGVIQAVSQTVGNTSYLRDKTIAHWVAMNRLTEVRLAGSPPNEETTSGTTEMAGQQWRWTMEVTQTELDSMVRIEIKVARDGTDKKSSLAAITGFYGTAVAPPGAVTVQWDVGATPQPTPGGENPQPDDKDKEDG